MTRVAARREDEESRQQVVAERHSTVINVVGERLIVRWVNAQDGVGGRARLVEIPGIDEPPRQARLELPSAQVDDMSPSPAAERRSDGSRAGWDGRPRRHLRAAGAIARTARQPFVA